MTILIYQLHLLRAPLLIHQIFFQLDLKEIIMEIEIAIQEEAMIRVVHEASLLILPLFHLNLLSQLLLEIYPMMLLSMI